MITLPWFAKELSPNTKCHWSKKGKAAKAARQYAFITSREAGYTKVAKELGNNPKTLSIVFYPPSKRGDLDNMLASMKNTIDGIADAIGINDKHFSYIIRRAEVFKGGKIEVEILDQCETFHTLEKISDKPDYNKILSHTGKLTTVSALPCKIKIIKM